LDERGRRRWAASEAIFLRRGGITAVADATGISDRTIRNGIRELNDPNPLLPNRRRRGGSGRKSRTDEQPELVTSLERLVEPDSRGDPQSPLRWTCKSTRTLTLALQADGYTVSYTKVRQLLKSSGFSLQSNRKTREGADHLDRNAQFEHIAKRVVAGNRVSC
jgi:transposase